MAEGKWKTVTSLLKLRDGMKLRVPWPEDADGQKWSTRHGVLRGDRILLDTRPVSPQGLRALRPGGDEMIAPCNPSDPAPSPIELTERLIDHCRLRGIDFDDLKWVDENDLRAAIESFFRELPRATV